jgi:hypothetical protein
MEVLAIQRATVLSTLTTWPDLGHGKGKAQPTSQYPSRAHTSSAILLTKIHLHPDFVRNLACLTKHSNPHLVWYSVFLRR